jgi:maltooligosyltrehalose trehalohydrolase
MVKGKAELRIWAPGARKVEIDVIGEGRRALEAAARGHFELAGPGLSAGTRFLVRLDGGPGVPDPRSQRQPDGVHGPSEVVDQDAFVWTDAGFAPAPLARAIIYELHVGTFTPAGTFLGLLERLDHLVELGVTHVELMPVCEFPGSRGWGYDGVALYAPHHAYGTPDELKRLVDGCHARGLAVLLDVVYNHLGPDGNYLGQFGPYFTATYATPWGPAVNLDGAGSDEVRRFFCDNALHWLDNYHLDGLRLDAIHAFMDRSAIPFLEQLSREVHDLSERLGREKVLIAESDLNDPRVVRPRAAGGLGCDAQWSDDLHHALHALTTGERSGYYADFGALEDVARALSEGFVYAGRYSPHRDRVHGRPLGDVPLPRLLGYLQTHDQVGNRARGDRIGHTLQLEQLELCAALVMTGASVPMLFQGEEWNASSPFCYFTDHQDRELAAAVSRGRRREFAAFGWAEELIPDPQARETFEASRLVWEEIAEPAHTRLLAWYRSLARLRRSEPDLTSEERPSVSVDTASGRWLTSRRGRVLVCANFSGEGLRLPQPGRAEVLLVSPGTRSGDGIQLGPHGVAVLRLES